MARDRLKQRLTGAIALILAGVIAWFWLLDADDGGFQVAEESVIPAAPDIAPFTVEEPRIPEGLADTPAPDFDRAGADQLVAEDVAPAAGVGQRPRETAPAEQPVSRPAPAPTAAPKPAPAATVAAPAEPVARPQRSPEQQFSLDREGAPQGWVVQVASLSSDANAQRLVKELQGAGFKAFSRPAQSGGATIQRVFAGPWLSREQAAAQQQTIAERFKVKPIVVQFEP